MKNWEPLTPAELRSEQASDELGLDIVGAIPAVKPDQIHAEPAATQLVEAFRTIRLSVSQAADPSGRVLGRFVPLIDMSEWEPISADVSEQELDRRAQSQEKRYTTAEVLAHLEKQ